MTAINLNTTDSRKLHNNLISIESKIEKKQAEIKELTKIAIQINTRIQELAVKKQKDLLTRSEIKAFQEADEWEIQNEKESRKIDEEVREIVEKGNKNESINC